MRDKERTIYYAEIITIVKVGIQVNRINIKLIKIIDISMRLSIEFLIKAIIFDII